MNLKYLIVLVSITIVMSCGKKTQETKPIRKDITETVFASGILEAKDTYFLVAQAEGYLTEINFNEGDVITKGTILASIDNKESYVNDESSAALLQIAQNNISSYSPALSQAQKAIDIAKEKMKQDAIQENRYKNLWEENSIAKVDYENAILNAKTSKLNFETSLENLKKLQQDANQQLINSKTSKRINSIIETKNQIKAVVSGKVYKKNKQVGDYIKRGDILATIGNSSKIYAKVSVDESNISKVIVGQEVDVQLNTNKDKIYKAVVSEILPSFNEESQSFMCKLEFITPLDFNIINTQLQSNIIVRVKKNALLIPRNFIDFGGMVQLKNEKEKRKIKTNLVSNEWVEVIDGIDDNAVLITDNIASNNIKTSEAGSQLAK